MAVPTSTRRSRPRFGLEAGLVAAVRGLAFAGLMLAGLGLLAVILAVVGLTALGAGVLIVGHGGPRDQRALLSLLMLGDRESTRLNSSHTCISYALLFLQKKNT